MRRRGSRSAEPPDPPDPTAALEIAVRFLGTRPRTRWELERRLRRAAVDDDTIAATVERLADLGYLDDAAFARWWGDQRDRHRPRGRRLIEAELRQHGVPRDVIEAYRAEHDAPERPPEEAGLPASEGERARAALDAHLRGRPMPTEAKAVARLGAFLMRRGFDGETVRTTLRAASVASAADAEDDPPEERDG
jgi:regulatory protein